MNWVYSRLVICGKIVKEVSKDLGYFLTLTKNRCMNKARNPTTHFHGAIRATRHTNQLASTLEES